MLRAMNFFIVNFFLEILKNLLMTLVIRELNPVSKLIDVFSSILDCFKDIFFIIKSHIGIAVDYLLKVRCLPKSNILCS